MMNTFGRSNHRSGAEDESLDCNNSVGTSMKSSNLSLSALRKGGNSKKSSIVKPHSSGRKLSMFHSKKSSLKLMSPW